MRILVVKHGALGDVVRTAFILRPLVEKYGAATKIDWITDANSVPLLAWNPYISSIVVLGATECVPMGDKTIVVSSISTDTYYDWVISLDDEYRAADIASSISCKKLTGAYVSNGTVCYTDDSARWFDMGLISRHGKAEADRLKKNNKLSHKEILENILDIKIEKPLFLLSPENTKPLIINKKSLPAIGLNLGAGRRWESKKLSSLQADALVERLIRDSWEPYLFCGPEDEEYISGIVKRSRKPIQLVRPKTTQEYAAWIACMDCVISSDSLGMHLAIAQSIPTVAFFAPTSAAEIEMFGRGAKVTSEASDYCTYKSVVDTTTITADRIISALYELRESYQ